MKNKFLLSFSSLKIVKRGRKERLEKGRNAARKKEDVRNKEAKQKYNGNKNLSSLSLSLPFFLHSFIPLSGVAESRTDSLSISGALLFLPACLPAPFFLKGQRPGRRPSPSVFLLCPFSPPPAAPCV